MEYLLLLFLFLSGQLIVAFMVAHHYQAKLNRRLKAEHEYILQVQKQLNQLADIQRSYQALLAENKALREQHVQIQREQFLASLN